jgi:hypothetical protein
MPLLMSMVAPFMYAGLVLPIVLLLVLSSHSSFSRLIRGLLRAADGKRMQMKRHIACLAFIVVFVRVSSAQHYNRVAHLKDAPFSAEWQGSETIPDSSSAFTVGIARASDGSVYEATVDPIGEFKGSIETIGIEDVTSNCNIGISPYRSHLTKNNQGHIVGSATGLSISLEAGQSPASPFPTIEDIRDKNLREQERISRCAQICKPDATIRQTSLGEKTVDGMTIFGFQLEHMLDSKTDRVEERWESELGFTYSFHRTSSPQGRISAYSLAGLKLAEPPAELFTIQDRYFPSTSALPNAKTIFVLGLLGDAELTARIESILTASGRFTIAMDSKTADLVVAAKTDPDPNGVQAHSPFRPIWLEVDRPGRGPIFLVSLSFNGAPDQWAQSPVVSTCFANLWKRVESLQAPYAAIDDELF